MKFSFFLFLSLIISLMLSQGLAQTTVLPKPQTQAKKWSYIIGTDIGRRLKQQKFDLDLKYLFMGIEDSINGKESRLTQEEIEEALKSLQKKMMTKVSEENLKKGLAYLAENAKKEGVITTKSGLQYEILRAGTGAIPKSTDTVEVHYKGTLIDGKEFDSSYRADKPAIFPVTGVIPGWVEALQLMRKGAKWKLVIPSHLAYGDKPAGRMIGPNSTLIFEVELIDIK